MDSHEYSITLFKPELLTSKIVEDVFFVVREECAVCLSDIKRKTGFKYDVIRAALHFLEMRKLISVMKEEAQRLGIGQQQMPVKLTKAGRGASLDGIRRMLSEGYQQFEESDISPGCEKLIPST